MDEAILVRDLDKAIPPTEIDQDLDVRYNSLHCVKTTLRDGGLNRNQYLEVDSNHDIVPKLKAGERERERERERGIHFCLNSFNY